MKNNRFMKIAALSSLLVGSAAALTMSITSITTPEAVTPSDSVEIGEGNALAFPAKRLNAAEVDTIHTSLGIQYFTADDGTYSIRVIAALDGYEGLSAASFTRSLTSEDGTDLGDVTLPVTTVYTSYTDAASVKWTEELPDTCTYFMVYTMENIPSTEELAKLDITFTATPVTGDPVTREISGNVIGIMGEADTGGVTWTYGEMETLTDNAVTNTAAYGGYYVGPGYIPAGTEAITVPGEYYTYEGYVATHLGTVTGLAEHRSNYGAFESLQNKDNIATLTLPDTIAIMDSYCLSGLNALKTMNFPRDLEQIGNNALSSPTLDVLNYDAVNLTTENMHSQFSNDIGTVNVSHEVEVLPEALTNGTIGRINYEGTEAEWAALSAGTDWVSADTEVICSDTEVYTVTFHLGDGTLNGSAADVTRIVIGGKTVADIGTPSPNEAGLMFDGWYTAETGGEKYDFEAPVTTNVDLYAHYVDIPDGYSIDSPAQVSEATSGTASTFGDLLYYYIEFTAPTTDGWYFELYDVQTDSSNDPEIVVYDATTHEEIEGNEAAIDPTSDKKITGFNDRMLRIDMTEGESVILRVAAGASYSGDEIDAGSFSYAFFTAEGDSFDEAPTLEINVETEVDLSRAAGRDQRIPHLYRIEVAESTSYALTHTSSETYGWNFTLYSDADGTVSEVATYTASSPYSVISFEAGVTYYLEVSSSWDDTFDEGDTFTITLGDLPEGASMDNPIAYTLGESIAIAFPSNVGCYYYGTHLDAGSYRISLDGGNSSYAKKVVIYDANREAVHTVTEEGESSGGYWGDTTYGTDLEDYFTLETAGDCYIYVGYSSTPSSSSTINFTLTKLEEGDAFAYPHEVAWEGTTLTLANGGDTDGVYYTFTGFATGAYTIAPSVTEGVTVELYTASQALIGTLDGTARIEITEGETYYVVVKGDTASLTLTYAAYVGPLTEYSEYLGLYNGCSISGSSYYTITLTEDGLYWEGSSSLVTAVEGSIEEANGTLYVEFVDGNTHYYVYTNGTQAICFRGTSGYFMSKECLNYSPIGVGGDALTTSDFGFTLGADAAMTGTGSNLISVSVHDPADGETVTGRSYCLIKDGEVYFNVEVAETTDETTGDVTGYTVTTTAGTYTYTVSGSTLTLVA